jgi:hypothetical protein
VAAQLLLTYRYGRKLILRALYVSVRITVPSVFSVSLTGYTTCIYCIALTLVIANWHHRYH